jgi:hypothetical protein
MFLYGDGPANIKLKPSATYHVETPEYNYTAYSNALGLRDYEFPKAKPPGTIRVVVVGSSIAFAPGVPLDETFVKRLERKLAADPPIAGKFIQVINVGIPSYSAGQNYFSVRDVAAELDADAVVLEHSGGWMEWPFKADSTGFPRDYRVTQEEWNAKRPDQPPHKIPQPAIPEWLNKASDYSRVAHLIRDAARDWQLRGYVPESEYKLGDVWNDPFWPMRDPNFAQTDAWKLHERIMLATAHVADAAGRKFLLMTVPMGAEVNNYEWDWGRTVHGFKPNVTISDEPEARVRDLLAKKGYETLDVLPALRRESAENRRMFFSYDGHLTDAGNEVVADAMVPAIKSLLTGLKQVERKPLVDSLVASTADAQIDLSDGTATIVTAPGQYLYAASLPFDCPDGNYQLTGISAKIRVLEGRVQFGVLNGKGQWAAVSGLLSAGPDQFVQLDIPPQKKGQAVFANAAVANGNRSKMRVSDLKFAGCAPS